ncbi:hypothetical protein D2E76_23210 [Mycobacteroides abscessus]|uniref:Bacteriophage protein n=1 Tax=Mycobacteroides abscessus TaxID=36809 RepID=A0ABD7HID4_9MYCO|nr:hypothetical protein [Mycobacteroides abscessus]RIT32723.1 hypothetical protein D2E76_23210 [Mycobacteroides abscessus]
MNTISREHPVARKPHRCNMCYRRIEPGERYLKSFNVDSGEGWTWKECEHCDAMLGLLWHQLLEPLDYGEGYDSDTMGEFEPSTIGEARLKVYWRHGWRRRDGTLRPVPEPPVKPVAA